MTPSRIIFSFVLLLNIALQILPSYADNAVPVLLWGGSVNADLATSAVNPFLKTSSEEFDSFLRKKLESSPPVLLYVKDNLCTEDLVKHKQQLQKVAITDSLKYFPAVEKAVNTIEDIPFYNQTYNDYVDSVSDGQLLIVPIANLDTIPETYRTIKDSSPNLITILTGRSCTYRRSERVKREISTNDTKPYYIFYKDGALLYTTQQLSILVKDVPQELPDSATVELDAKGNLYTLRLKFKGSTKDSTDKHKLEFLFEIENGYYMLRTVNYTNIPKDKTSQSLKTNTDIVFPFNFSYHCSQDVIFKGDETILSIKNMQVQFDTEIVDYTTARFSDAYDCVGFTTIPIWTGIFVTGILALIMIWGLSMIIDIRTMDRFDDPKGKTITISSQE